MNFHFFSVPLTKTEEIFIQKKQHKLMFNTVAVLWCCSLSFFLCNWYSCFNQVNTMFVHGLVDLATLPSHGDQSKNSALWFSQTSLLENVY